MKDVQGRQAVKARGWILFFYRVPSKPVSNRMRLWRRLIKTGAVQLKGTVYILPYTDEHYEFLQWLVSEIAGMKGEGAFARVKAIDTMDDAEIIVLFDRQRTDDYKAIGKALDDLERRLQSIPKGAKTDITKRVREQFGAIVKDYEAVKRVDFFSSKEGERLAVSIKRVQTSIKTLSDSQSPKERPVGILSRRAVDYRGKTWITRKNPFIDRMASAWLIKRFIDQGASFAFVAEREMVAPDKGPVSFDIRGGEFTHTDDMCTFEVLIKSFGLRDSALKKIAGIVHDLDVKDEKFKAVEARGLEDILTGIRKTAKNDHEALKAGMQVFEMLYMSKS